MGGMPPGGAPMDPAAMGGAMPPGMDPAMAGGAPPGAEDPMAQIGPVLQEVMGAMEQMSTLVQQLGQQMTQIAQEHQNMQKEVMQLGLQVQQMEKSLNEPSPYDQVDPAAAMGADPAAQGAVM